MKPDIQWEEYRCPICQCGTSIPASDPQAKEKLAEYIKKHKCHTQNVKAMV